MAGRVIRLKELVKHTGLSKSVIYDRMDPKSPRHDPSFPRSFSLGGAAVGWYLEDVDRWLQGCAEPDQQKVVPRPAEASTKSRAPSVSARFAPGGAVPAATEVPGTATNLVEALIVGGQLNAKLTCYLQMTTWSSTMAALLVSGVEPPQNCEGIPEGGTGLDGRNLHASDGRFHDARRILKAWNYVDEEEGDIARPSTFTPAEFLEWCIDERRTHGDWLSYLLELSGFQDSKAPDFSAARLEHALRKTKLP